MLHLLPSPSNLPGYRALLDDLGAPSTKRLAKALGVTARTARRWMVAGQAPRPAMLALFWVSRWGQSQLNSEAWHGLDLYRGLASALQRERDELLSKLAKVGTLAEFGSANDPSPLIPRAMREAPLGPVLANPTPGAETAGGLAAARRRLAKLQRRLERRRRRDAREREQREASARAQREERVARSRARRRARQQRAA